MSNLTLKYARNGALASLGLYTIAISLLLVVSFSYEKARVGVSSVDGSMGFYQQLSQSVPAMLMSRKAVSGRQSG
ncbi:hypothetical protein TUM18999_23700 [Pseudomonas tohonis]|uniref:Uncharacterized protein n=1 Tax=Pseudomonas tohonis TaxID=2725477 RepID=A0A6J4E496_9PSED|nr:hypothetical protein [Pseudomonas tohonis]BCG24179.1 hypothetical protein TUM18999_23700 [Pseudomonas tohonis]GJN55714.1 hypothetical protein TUM20286_54660 [Pseudomonas tohonis]